MTAEHDAETRVEDRTDDLGEIAAQSEAADRAETEPQPPEAEDSTDETEPQPEAEEPTDEIAETESELSADDPADKIIEPDPDAEDQAKRGVTRSGRRCGKPRAEQIIPGAGRRIDRRPGRVARFRDRRPGAL